ncbi:MAG: hypothetical protein GWO24_25950, partial [Akkermansiaceae bacterium]|nr:hypothetical protein [Akkermansiaceae bacterium]
TWIGLSDSGSESKWHWIDGRPVGKALWGPGQPDNTRSPDDGEDFAALLPDDRLDDLPASRQLPFLLQWTEKSANQGSIAAQLSRTGEAFRRKRTPTFPAGTRNIGGSRFLLVPQAVSWEEASAIAKAAGGHLAVPSSDAEAAWIRESLQKVLGGGDGCWVGGRLAGTASPQWTFVTDEKFEFVTWAPGQPHQGETPQPFLKVWRGVDGTFGFHGSSGGADQASYILVEWSAPSRRNMPSREDLRKQHAGVSDWLVEQREETSDREKVSFQRWKRRHDKNVEDFADDVNSEADTARRQEARALENIAKEFTNAIKKEGRIPDKINPIAERFVGRIHQKFLKKQKGIWEDYHPEFAEARERYLSDVGAEMERRKKTGDPKGAAYLSRELKAAAEKDYFMRILDGEFP